MATLIKGATVAVGMAVAAGSPKRKTGIYDPPQNHESEWIESQTGLEPAASTVRTVVWAGKDAIENSAEQTLSALSSTKNQFQAALTNTFSEEQLEIATKTSPASIGIFTYLLTRFSGTALWKRLLIVPTVTTAATALVFPNFREKVIFFGRAAGDGKLSEAVNDTVNEGLKEAKQKVNEGVADVKQQVGDAMGTLPRPPKLEDVKDFFSKSGKRTEDSDKKKPEVFPSETKDDVDHGQSNEADVATYSSRRQKSE